MFLFCFRPIYSWGTKCEQPKDRATLISSQFAIGVSVVHRLCGYTWIENRLALSFCVVLLFCCFLFAMKMGLTLTFLLWGRGLLTVISGSFLAFSFAFSYCFVLSLFFVVCFCCSFVVPHKNGPYAGVFAMGDWVAHCYFWQFSCSLFRIFLLFVLSFLFISIFLFFVFCSHENGPYAGVFCYGGVGCSPLFLSAFFAVSSYLHPHILGFRCCPTNEVWIVLAYSRMSYPECWEVPVLTKLTRARPSCWVCSGLCEERLQRFKANGVNEEAVIGEKICRIIPAEEPSEILWHNIDAGVGRR